MNFHPIYAKLQFIAYYVKYPSPPTSPQSIHIMTIVIMIIILVNKFKTSK